MYFILYLLVYSLIKLSVGKLVHLYNICFMWGYEFIKYKLNV